MTKEQILGLKLIELEGDDDVKASLRLLEGVANDRHRTEPVFETKEAFNTALKKAAAGLKEAFKRTEENLKTTTVNDVLEGWKRKHQHYLDIKDRVFRQVHLSVMSTFFHHLISLGFPKGDLVALPSGQFILDTHTIKQVFERDTSKIST